MKRLAYRLAVALLTFFVGVATTMFQSRPRPMFTHSTVSLTAEAPRAARRCAEVARILEPANVSRAEMGEAYSQGRVGDDLRRAGCFQEAASAYAAAISADASYAPAYADLSNTYNHLGRYEEAIAVAKRGLKVGDDGDAYLYNEIGYAQKGLSQYAEAVEAFRRAVALEPDNAYAHSTLGGAYFRLNRYREALAEAEHGASLADRSNDVAALNNAALVIADLRRYDESVAMLQRSLNMDINHVPTRLSGTRLGAPVSGERGSRRHGRAHLSRRHELARSRRALRRLPRLPRIPPARTRRRSRRDHQRRRDEV
jgi:tetratricopeptide (TPR) repeat protein